MIPSIDLTGKRFGRLVAIRYSDKNDGRKAWVCRCECGVVKEIRGAQLRNGRAISCGCLRLERLRDGLNKKHGGYYTPTHKSWDSMVQRCTNPNDSSHHKYGARGVTVCQRWMDSFEAFLADMGERPPGTTLDRWPNRRGNYEPGNCRWATPLQQSNNLNNNFRVDYAGKTYTLRELSEATGVPYDYLRNRVYRKRCNPAEVINHYEQALRQKAA